jgi:hypothetical protein
MLQIKTLDSFNGLVNHVAKTYPYAIEIKGMRKKIVANGKYLATYRPGKPNPELQSKQARRLMMNLRGSVTKYINKVKMEVPEIEKEYPVVFTNRLFWESIPAETEFYIIDAKHAYWRIAFILGYIGKALYSKYAENKDLKQAKNISLAVLNSMHKKEYYIKDKKVHEIICDTSLYSRVYNNIRYFSYNLCGRLRNDLDDACFAYRTDGVFLLKPGLNRAKKIFEKNNLLYKIEKCVKIDNKSYSNMDGEMKRFT